MTLSDILARLVGGGTGMAQSAGNTVNDRQAYVDYTLACQEGGNKPLPFDRWVAAGRPKA